MNLAIAQALMGPSQDQFSQAMQQLNQQTGVDMPTTSISPAVLAFLARRNQVMQMGQPFAPGGVQEQPGMMQGQQWVQGAGTPTGTWPGPGSTWPPAQGATAFPFSAFR